jgi:hypothetical protein
VKRPNIATLLIGALVLAAAIALLVTAFSPGPDNPQAPPAKTVTLGGPGHDKIVLTPPAQAIVKDAVKDDQTPATKGPGQTESNLNAPDPPASVVKQSQDLRPPGQPVVPPHVPLASAQVPGCATKEVRNQSSRRGAPVLLGVIHWTGSRPTPGSPASGLAIVSWFDQAAAGASSSEITDQDGRCWLTVPESQKPWTNVAYNSWSVTVEIVNQGVMPLFQTSRARNAVIRLMRGWHARWRIPYRRAVVAQSPCHVVRSGFIDHKALGSCGGGHPDVGSFDMASLIRGAASADNCNARCRRAQDLRARNKATHAELRRLGCKPAGKTKRARCTLLWRRDRAVHKAAGRERIKL